MRTELRDLLDRPEFPGLRRVDLAEGGMVLLLPRRETEVISLQVYFPGGTAYEADQEVGLTNLLLSVMLKGTASRSARQLAQDLASLGTHLSMGSGRHHANLGLQAIPSVLPQALEIFWEVLFEPALEGQELEKERARILEGIKANLDRPLYRAFRLFLEAFYQDTPFRHPVEGYPLTVSRFTLEQVRAYAQGLRAGSPVLAAVGQIEPGEIQEELVARLTDRPRGAPLQARPTDWSETEQVGRSEALESASAWVVIGFPAPALEEQFHGAMLVLDALLGSSLSSRLFTEVRERRGLAYQVGTVYRAYSSPSYLAAYLATDPARQEEAVEVVLNEFSKVTEEGVAEDELELVRRYIVGTYLMGGESSDRLAERLALYHAHGLGPQFGFEVLKQVLDLSPEWIRDAAAQYFHDPVVAVVGPALEKASEDE